MKQKIKMIALVCTAVFAVSMFGGCVDNTPSPTPSPTDVVTPTDEVEPTEPVDEGYVQPSADQAPTLVWWQIGTQPSTLADGVSNFNEYTAEKIGAKIDIKVAGWGDWATKMNTIINSGEAFDIMFVNNTNYGQFVNLGALADITDMIPEYIPELQSFIPQKVWDGTKIKGQIYAVPTYKDSSITQYYVWDDTYVQKYSLDIQNIKSMKDLDAAVRTIKDGEGANFYPLPLFKADGWNGFFNDYDDLTLGLQPIGVKLDDQTKTVVCTLEQQDVMDNLKLLNQWYEDGIVNPDAPTLAEPLKQRPFFAAQAFPGAETNYQINEGVAKYVMQDMFGPMFTTSSIQGSMNAISVNSQNPIEALKYLQLANLDWEMRNMLAYGIKDVDWKDLGGNVIERLTDTWTLPGYSQATFFNLASVSPNPGNQWDSVKELNERAASSVILGFAFDPTNVEAEVANCKSVWEKYKYDLLTGASNPEEIVPTIISELKAAGMDTIISEAQAQITAAGF